MRACTRGLKIALLGSPRELFFPEHSVPLTKHTVTHRCESSNKATAFCADPESAPERYPGQHIHCLRKGFAESMTRPWKETIMNQGPPAFTA